MADKGEEDQKYDERIFRNLDSFSKVQFALLKLGPLCNATKSRSFTEADCDFERIKDGDIPIAANFSLIFKPGVSLLKDIRDGKKKNLFYHEKTALRKLHGYVKVLGIYIFILMCFNRSGERNLRWFPTQQFLGYSDFCLEKISFTV